MEEVYVTKAKWCRFFIISMGVFTRAEEEKER
jgi:hypothetical protein